MGRPRLHPPRVDAGGQEAVPAADRPELADQHPLRHRCELPKRAQPQRPQPPPMLRLHVPEVVQRQRSQEPALRTRGEGLKLHPLKVLKVSTPNRGSGFDKEGENRVRLRQAKFLAAFDISTQLPRLSEPFAVSTLPLRSSVRNPASSTFTV